MTAIVLTLLLGLPEGWYRQPVTQKDLEGLPSAELRILRNEIFARHGYVFKAKDLQSHFAREPWYVPNPAFTPDALSAIEKANVEILRAAEDKAKVREHAARVEAAPAAASRPPSSGASDCPADMATLPGGAFTMGNDTVTVQAFCLDITEVTLAAYAKCVKKGTCTAPAPNVQFSNWGYRDRDDHPVNAVEWRQANAFCAALGKRLPTQEEWVWAARGAELGSTFPWGEAPPTSQLCWNGEGSELGIGKRESTCPVGKYPRSDSPQGIHDLAGNVAEWTASRYRGGSDRVVKGGSWGSEDPLSIRGEYLGSGYDPLYPYSTVGFRCAQTR